MKNALLLTISSGHAKEALELSKLQEMTRQKEQMTKIKEYEAAIEQSKIEQKKIDYEERRKTLQVCYYQFFLILFNSFE